MNKEVMRHNTYEVMLVTHFINTVFIFIPHLTGGSPIRDSCQPPCSLYPILLCASSVLPCSHFRFKNERENNERASQLEYHCTSISNRRTVQIIQFYILSLFPSNASLSLFLKYLLTTSYIFPYLYGKTPMS